MLIAAGLTDTNAIETARPWRTLEEGLPDHGRNG